MTNKRTWRNWSGTVHCAPELTVRPRSVRDMASVVRDAGSTGRHVRARGAGHSSTELAASDDVVLDLSSWSGVEHVDEEACLATVRSGTTLRRLNAELDALGLAMANLGDIDRQTVAGAISTATHGTGLRVPGLSSQVRALELVRADGSVVRCSAGEHPELFAAARAGLGAVGVITRVTLAVVPSFSLSAREFAEPVERVLARFADYAKENRHFEFYWFPHGRNALVKLHNELPAGTRPRPLHPARHWFEYELLENSAFGSLCGLAKVVPATVRPLNRLCSALLSTRSYSDRSHRVLTTNRRVRFVECEYAVPYESVHDVFDAVRAEVARRRLPVMFPAEVRVAPEDDVWLSPAYGRTTAYISVQQAVGLPYREYFELFQAIAAAAAGRPHWGKTHSMDGTALAERVPMLDAFRRVRAAADPDGVFGSPYLDRLLGTPARAEVR